MTLTPRTDHGQIIRDPKKKKKGYINAGCALTKSINWEKSKSLRDVSEGIVVAMHPQETKVLFMKTA